MLNTYSLSPTDVTEAGPHSSIWLYKPSPLRNPRLRLYCFPYAGGNAGIFNSWLELLYNGVEINAISLPGRWSRENEQAITCMHTICLEVADAIRSDADIEYAFFGHSMGGILAYQVAQELRNQGTMLPDHLFVSGCQAPHANSDSYKRKRVSEMDEDELFTYISKLAGTPSELLNEESMRERIASTMLPDLTAIDNWRYVECKPLPIPITVFTGSHDPVVNVDRAREWKRHTTSDFNFNLITGDHFFINKEKTKLLRMINRTLECENLV